MAMAGDWHGCAAAPCLQQPMLGQQQFTAITGASDQQATHFLELANDSIETAIELYFTSGTEALAHAEPPPEPALEPEAALELEPALATDDSGQLAAASGSSRDQVESATRSGVVETVPPAGPAAVVVEGLDGVMGAVQSEMATIAALGANSTHFDLTLNSYLPQFTSL